MKKNRFSIGIAILGILLVFAEVIGYNYYRNNLREKSSIVVEEMKREPTTEGFKNPRNAVEYVLLAYQQNDLDKFLRGYAINEMVYGVKVENMIKENRIYSADQDYPPSGNFGTYAPITKTIITKEMIDLYEQLQEQIGEREQLLIKSIDYVNIKQQYDNSFLSSMYYECEKWGADYLVEVMALLEIRGEDYVSTFTVARYGQVWKVLKNEASLFPKEENQIILKTSEKEYYEKINSAQDSKQFEQDREIDVKEKVKKNDLLPRNYFISNELYEKSPNRLMEEYTTCFNRRDLVRAQGYGMIDIDEQSSIEEVINKQYQFSKELWEFCYNLVGRSALKGPAYLEKDGITEKQVVNSLNPEKLPYLRYVGIQNELDIDEITKECEIMFKYNGELIFTGVTLGLDEEGWKIKSLSAEHLGYQIGEAR